jgi:hypothetical protein
VSADHAQHTQQLYKTSMENVLNADHAIVVQIQSTEMFKTRNVTWTVAVLIAHHMKLLDLRDFLNSSNVTEESAQLTKFLISMVSVSHAEPVKLSILKPDNVSDQTAQVDKLLKSVEDAKFAQIIVSLIGLDRTPVVMDYALKDNAQEVTNISQNLVN